MDTIYAMWVESKLDFLCLSGMTFISVLLLVNIVLDGLTGMIHGWKPEDEEENNDAS